MVSLGRALGLGFSLLLVMPSALAQPLTETPPAAPEPTKEELAAARALFEKALALEEEKRWAEALERLEKVAQVKMTPQVRFHIALCHEHLGRLVDAINGFELAVQEARAVGERAKDVLESAPPRAEKLRDRVAHVTFTVQGTVRTSKIFIDGSPVSLALAETAIPIDPGEHRLEVRRGGEVIEARELYLEEGETQSVRLRIEDPLPPPKPKPKAPSPKPLPDEPPGASPEASSRIPAYVVGGVGAAGLIAAGVLFGLREKAISDVRCRDRDAFTGCNPADEATANEGQRYDIASKVLVGVGGAALATGVVLWFVLAPDDDAPPKTGTTQAFVDFGPSGATASVRIVLP